MAANVATLGLERRLRRALAGIVDEQTRDLVRAWAIAWDEVAPDLRDVLTEMLSEYAGTTVSRKLMSRSRSLQVALAAIQAQLEDLADNAGVRINQDLDAVVLDAARAQAVIIASELPDDQDLVDVDRKWTTADQQPLQAIVRRSTEQITSLARPLAPQAYDAVRRELIRGVAVGENPRATAQRMVRRAEGKFNGGLTRALVISRTEILDAHREAARVEQTKHADVLTGWVWLAELSPRTCRACLAMHGQEFGLEVPGPIGHQQCRCARQPKTKSWADLGFDIDEPADSTPGADAYFDGLTPEQQKAILGPKGYDAWVAGGFPRDAWAKRRENPGWRDAMVPASPPGGGKGGATPPAPPAGGDGGASTVPDEPPMGRVLGSADQQVYVTAPDKLQRATLQLLAEDNANFWPTYIPDPEDRATALLTYHANTERLVKQAARDLDAETDRSASTTAAIKAWFAEMTARTESGVTPKSYVLGDLEDDILGAAMRLLARPTERLGTVFRGIRIPGDYDLTDSDDVDLVISRIAATGWWFASASPDQARADRYSLFGAGPGAKVVLTIRLAQGVRFTGVGRMSPDVEVLLSGGIVVEDYSVVGSTIHVTGRWQP